MNFVLKLKHVYRQIKQMDSPIYGEWIRSVRSARECGREGEATRGGIEVDT
jgi:hypothetical protein